MHKPSADGIGLTATCQTAARLAGVDNCGEVSAVVSPAIGAANGLCHDAMTLEPHPRHIVKIVWRLYQDVAVGNSVAQSCCGVKPSRVMKDNPVGRLDIHSPLKKRSVTNRSSVVT